jgi:hypothetical protein
VSRMLLEARRRPEVPAAVHSASEVRRGGGEGKKMSGSLRDCRSWSGKAGPLRDGKQHRGGDGWSRRCRQVYTAEMERALRLVGGVPPILLMVVMGDRGMDRGRAGEAPWHGRPREHA